MRILKALTLTAALCGSLQAEESALFVGAMYEMGGSTFRAKVLGEGYVPKPGKNAITQGLGVHVGYNQLFGQKGWVGLRYYAFYNWGITDFGKFVPNHKVEFTNNTFNLSGYGVGLDLLLNFINAESFSVGVFGGLAVGGNTWWLVKGNNPQTKVQWLVNGGVRTVISKRHGLELGFKVPMMHVNYVETFNGSKFNNTTLFLKRDWAFTAAYYFYF
ncbi:outer membrane protein [Helicobacter salomonis]|uniref:OMP1457 n=1 Tax=Helicobacter salomonis TaxID=56878 RepID=A0A1M4NIR4_9HELI|nr:outer membrane protein [Helicobacter salomonis]SFZ73047.1 OMP1457 [Helicobacter salomonis]